MMTFYAAVGSYRTKKVDGRKMPYIQKLGRLHAISIPEFVIWSTLLWEVMTYDEVKKHFEEQMRMCSMAAPDFDELLDLLVKRKLKASAIPERMRSIGLLQMPLWSRIVCPEAKRLSP